MPNVTTNAQIRVGRRKYKLGERIGRGGEGEVFALGKENLPAVKIYKEDLRPTREKKIRAIVDANLADRVPVAAFPTDVVTDRRGQFLGFAMKYLAKRKPLYDLYSPAARKKHFPKANFAFIVQTAANIARAVARIHDADCVIGDLNHSSVLIGNDAIVDLIDADSFQYIDGNQRFLCRVAVPEYTPPELHGVRFDQVARTTNHDAFGLAIVIFQLLFMGRHPFVGTVQGGEVPQIADAIRNYRFVYSQRNVGMSPPPGTPRLEDLPENVGRLFERAFHRQHRESRPSAAEWAIELKSLGDSLVKCRRDPGHVYAQNAARCPWCFMDKALGVKLFETEETGHADGICGGRLDADRIWQDALILFDEVRAQCLGPLRDMGLEPTSEARRVERFGFLFRKRRSSYIDQATGQLQALRQQMNQAMRSWMSETGEAEIDSLRQQMSVARTAYDQLATSRHTLMATGRRSASLQGHLRSLEIRYSGISGIGPSRLATLASYGIETAADVNEAAILKIPGFGPAMASNLLDWRHRVEKGFANRQRTNKRTETRNRRKLKKIESSMALSRRTLQDSLQRLKQISRALEGKDDRRDALRAIHTQIEQLRSDLFFPDKRLLDLRQPDR